VLLIWILRASLLTIPLLRKKAAPVLFDLPSMVPFLSLLPPPPFILLPPYTSSLLVPPSSPSSLYPLSFFLSCFSSPLLAPP
jgi:hypothetical protein